MDRIERLRNRQLARLLAHLEKTGQLTIELEKDLKRAYRFAFEDVKTLIQELDKEKKDEQRF
jgi:glutamine synthetase adenylyltransferase